MVGDGLGASDGVSAGMGESDAVGDSRGADAPSEPQAELSAATNTRTIPTELRRIDPITPESEPGYARCPVTRSRRSHIRGKRAGGHIAVASHAAGGQAA